MPNEARRTYGWRSWIDPLIESLLAIGILFTLCMGGLGGLIPALSAMRIRPLESLR